MKLPTLEDMIVWLTQAEDVGAAVADDDVEVDEAYPAPTAGML